MCKACKMDPYEMKKFMQRQGAIEVEDFDDEPKYRHPKRRAKKSRARSQTRMPCPASEDGKHVYVWEPCESLWNYDDKIFYRHFGFYRYEKLTCCGCLQTKGYRRETEKYMKIKERRWRKLVGSEFDVKRGEPISRWGRWGNSFYNFTWEKRDAGYIAALEEWKQSKEAKAFEEQRILRRIEMRRKLLGYTN